jgi:hypothetical protein
MRKPSVKFVAPWSRPRWLTCPIYCKIIKVHCNAIQTLLQLNSNNSNICGKVRYFAVAVFRGEWRRMAVFSGPNSTKRDLVCAELICSEAGSDARNSLILRERVKLFAHFSRTYRSDAG